MMIGVKEVDGTCDHCHLESSLTRMISPLPALLLFYYYYYINIYL